MLRAHAPATFLLAALTATLAFDSCSRSNGQPAGSGSASPTPTPSAEPPSVEVFVPVQDQVGFKFKHVHGGTGERYFPETMVAGGGFLDYDNDGWLDIYVVQSGPMPGYPDPKPLPHQLFHNNGDGTFTDVTAASGAGDTAYGAGTCFGDIDNDGYIDIFNTSFGVNHLYRNNGNGTFADVTEKYGVGFNGWSSSCAFADYDRDGWLDLYVATYVDFTFQNHIRCGRPDFRQYCHPDNYAGVPDLLYHNQGGKTFKEVGREAGIHKDAKDGDKGLGVVWTDFNGDGYPDIYVANDSVPNFLFRNNGDGTFKEIAVEAGTAYGESGMTQAGMGTDAGDYDGDGRMDLFVTNLDFETNEMYRNRGDGSFDDTTAASGLGPPSFLDVGFGTFFFDFDNDGDLDIFVANGGVLDQVLKERPGRRYAQNPKLYENQGDGRFVDASLRSGAFFKTLWVSRGAAFGDIDNDGDLDVLMTNCNQSAVLLRNQTGNRNNWAMLKLKSRHGGRDAVGALVTLTVGGHRLLREMHAGSSYESQSDLRMHFGLGQARSVEHVQIRWPEGQVQEIAGDQIGVNKITVIDEPVAK